MRRLRLALAVLVPLLVPFAAAAATEASTVDRAEVESLISTLENDADRAKLISRLKLLIETRQPPPAESPVGELSQLAIDTLLDKWWQGGVTAAELEARKTNLVGSYQVGLATTGGMAGAMLQTVNRGKSLARLDEYPNDIKALSVEQVNAAIKKHLDPQKMVLIKVGTL